MFAQIKSLGLFGLNAFPVDVEVSISRGSPQSDSRTLLSGKAGNASALPCARYPLRCRPGGLP